MDKTLYLAVDPGGTTGWAVSPGYGMPRVEQSPGGLLGGMEDLMTVIDYATGMNRHMEIICEKYTIGGRTVKFSRQDDALKISGALEHIAHVERFGFTYQQPAEAKRVFTDDRLKAMDWYVPGKEHGRDATRHLALYLFKNRLIDIHGKARGNASA